MTELRLTSSAGTEKRVFTPVDAKHIRMYVCGPTVYNLVHIGNARPVVVFDTLFRVLQALYPKVTYARNITDIDDKIIVAAKERGIDITVLTEEFTEKFRTDMAALNNLPPSIEPQATEHVDAMLDLAQRLIDKGHAYESEGHVLFDVTSMDDYGLLSGRQLDDMLAGARVEVASYKRHPGDFVLWKPSSDDEPGWDSDYGRGRPGWHIECSAMIHQHLGDNIDIHGGGRDLIFPHHENERAQSCCGYGGSFVGTWMHNAYVDMDGEKMSKSLGNVKTVRELLEQYPGETLRFALLSAHYRSPLNFSRELLDSAQSTLDGFYLALRNAGDVESVEPAIGNSPVFTALLDDLNTPAAIAELHQLAKALNKASESEKPAARAALLAGGAVLGVLGESPDEWLAKDAEGGLSSDAIDQLLVERADAKANRDFARADAIRDELNAAGIIIEDSASGATWRRA
ncbi:cysteinyl-tRNA synthetase [gamma proteobacterium HIMB55]|nr:cysteinyl-tRNA synthetase [gamma proteobacterium HIMB55]